MRASTSPGWSDANMDRHRSSSRTCLPADQSLPLAAMAVSKGETGVLSPALIDEVDVAIRQCGQHHRRQPIQDAAESISIAILSRAQECAIPCGRPLCLGVGPPDEHVPRIALVQRYRRHHRAIALSALTVDLCARIRTSRIGQEDIMSAALLSPTRRELLAAAAAAGAISMLPGTLHAAAGGDAIRPFSVSFPQEEIDDLRRRVAADAMAGPGNRHGPVAGVKCRRGDGGRVDDRRRIYPASIKPERFTEGMFERRSVACIGPICYLCDFGDRNERIPWEHIRARPCDRKAETGRAWPCSGYWDLSSASH